ncbi:alpha/beta hydrolase fold domain-containing protein [Deinococcus sp. QL22]|uniref:alpha/beta hydrolase fold domain-containing protein n=1 Tax=Deinococcus sp. QL22 TaxID=2939437 RepID=UPI002017F444|nr:alpha/beta hydrolase fold domain-containing protein [Deinococcus sp. QL22]UQN07984.1 alpha/beta hydrolase [Deinococcus sp. QL22]
MTALVRTTVVSGAGTAVPVRLFQPAIPGLGWLVWAHGGSWTSGSAAAWHEPCEDLARRADITVVSVDYRLAPIFPYPAALEDLLAVLAWVARQPELGHLPRLLAVGGDSAGATLAASAALAFRDQGGVLGAQVLAYPPLDPACRAPSYLLDPLQFPHKESLLAAWRAYAGDQPGIDRAYLAPLNVESLHGLAPAIIGVGDRDPVRDDVRTYAARLQAAGVAVQLRNFAGEGHALFLTRPSFRAWLAAALRQRFDDVLHLPSAVACASCEAAWSKACIQP